VLIVALLMIVGVVAAAGAAPAPKVDVCHQTSNQLRGYILINVSGNAYDAHIAHDDAAPGEAVPGMPGFEFNADCLPVKSLELTLLVTVAVPGTSDVGISSKITLASGVVHELRAEGTYRFAKWGEFGIADALCNYRDAAHGGPGWINGDIWAAPVTSWLQVMYGPATGTPINWLSDASSTHVCDAGNAYTATVTGTGSTLSFVIMDDNYSDNSGFIWVEIWGWI
jgi:hypothetical protein